MSKQRSGGRIIVDSFLQHGVEHVFCVPGESYLDILDALVDVSNRINLVSARQEGGAAYMAEAYGKLTGKPGVCMVTRSGRLQRFDRGSHRLSGRVTDDRPRRPDPP